VYIIRRAGGLRLSGDGTVDVGRSCPSDILREGETRVPIRVRGLSIGGGVVGGERSCSSELSGDGAADRLIG
jgi:hypothetical protein